MSKKRSIPGRVRKPYKKEYKFIDMPKEKFIRDCVILGVVILAIILFFVLRSAFDGHLSVKDGVVVTQEGENWVVSNNGTKDSPRYFKIAEVTDVPGYRLEREEGGFAGDTNVLTYNYYPEGESPIVSAYVGTGNGEYNVLSESARASYGSYMTGAVIGEAVDTEFAGKPARYFTYRYSYTAQNEDGTPGEATYYAGVNLYVKAGHGRCVILHLSAENAQEAALPTDDAIIALIPDFAPGVVID